MIPFGTLVRAFTLATVMMALPRSAIAQQDFYAGKTIRLIVGFASGAAFDRVARILAGHMPNHIPGKPAMIVQNMVGAGSIVAANYLFNVAPKDGTVVGNINGSIITQELAEQGSITFKSVQFNWLGAIGKTRIACMINKNTGVTSMDDLMKPRANLVNLGAQGPGTEITTTPVFLRFVGGQVKVIAGYPGAAQIYLAAERGELDGSCAAWESMKVTGSANLKSGKFTVFVQDGETKSPELPEAQLMVDALKNPVHKKLWAALSRPQAITRPYALPPGVPTDRVAILRKAYDDTMKDPAFIAAMAKSGDQLEPSSSAEVAAVVEQIMATPAELKVDLNKLLTID